MLTDTTFWIDLDQERRQEPGPAHAFLAAHRSSALRVSIITWGELAPAFALEDALVHWLRGVRVLRLHQHVAWEASRIERELRGRRLGENDNWIAATARTWGLPIVSRDQAFDRVPRLRRVAY